MDLLHMTPEQKEVLRAARDFARGEFDKENILDMARSCRFPGKILKKASDLGFTGIHIPEKSGGGGMGMFEYSLLAEAFCSRDITMGTALLTSDLGSEILSARLENKMASAFLQKILAGKTCCAIIPSCSHSMKKTNRTVARPDGDHFILSGEAAHVMHGMDAGCFVLHTTIQTGDDSGGHQAILLVDGGHDAIKRTPEGQTLGLCMIPFAHIRFEDIHVSEENILFEKKEAETWLKKLLAVTRTRFACIAAGCAKGAFERALSYIKEREQFGRKLAAFPVTRHKIAKMKASMDTAFLSARTAAKEHDDGKLDPLRAAEAKYVASTAAVEVSDEAIQLLGGYGYMTEYEVERYYRDAKTIEILFGNPHALLETMACQVIGRIP